MIRPFRWLIFVVIFSIALTGLVGAAVPVMPVSDLREGMRGVGKTVVQGTEIEEFSVEILGVLKNQGSVENLILVRISGPLIDKTGGIAQGMSGSPVLIDGKLVGAVAYGWGFSDGRLGLLTPAEDMVKLWDLPAKPYFKREVIDISKWQDLSDPKISEKARWNEITKTGVTVEESEKGDASKPEEEKAEEPKKKIQLPEVTAPEGGIRPLATPVMVSGMTPKAMELLKERLAVFNLVPYESGSGGAEDVGGTIEPGSAIGAQLVRGDISMGALGTTTWVDNGKVIAFGHPFIHEGQSNYFMTSAKVVGVIPSVNSAFKLGTIGKTVGIIDQDRTAGIGGTMNQYPHITTVKLAVIDGTEKRERTFKFDTIQDEKLSPVLIPVSVYSGIDRVVDRSTGGTVFIQTRIKAKELPKGEFTRGEMFYGTQDAAKFAVSELDLMMNLLAKNPFESVHIDEIEIKVSLMSERKAAQILRAGTAAREVFPGETIEVEVELLPYREQVRVEKIKYTIPEYASPGKWYLNVRGGATPLLTDEMPSEVVYQIWQLQKGKWMAPRSLKDLVNTYLALDHSQDLIVEGYFVPSKKDIERAEKNRFKLRPEEEELSVLDRNSLGTSEELYFYERSFRSKQIKPWIVYGSAQMYVNVKEGKSSDK